MNLDNEDILLTADGDDKVANGDFVIGNGVEDDCFSIMKLNTGALKYDVILGPNLIRLINNKAGDADIQRALRLHLERDNKMKFVKKLGVKNGVIKLEL